MVPTVRPEWWTDDLEISDATVDVSKLERPLQAFLIAAGALHRKLSNKPLVVTSGNDANHAQHSKHYIWKAVDIRAKDLTEAEADRFAAEMVPMLRLYRVGVFDERFIGQIHWHVECD